MEPICKECESGGGQCAYCNQCEEHFCEEHIKTHDGISTCFMCRKDYCKDQMESNLCFRCYCSAEFLRIATSAEEHDKCFDMDEKAKKIYDQIVYMSWVSLKYLTLALK